MGLKLRIGCMLYEPYTYFCEDIDDFCVNCDRNINLGIDFEIIISALQYGFGLNAINDAKFSLVKFTDLGSPLNIANPKGPWSGMIGAIKNNTIDIAAPSLWVTHNRLSAIDFPLPSCYFDHETFLVHPYIEKIKPASFLKIFQIQTWISWVASILLMSFIMIIVLKVKSVKLDAVADQKCSTQALNSIMKQIFWILFEKKSRIKWTTIQNRLMITLWSFSSILALCLFASSYVRSLTPNFNAKLPFRTVNELAELLLTQRYTMALLNTGANADRMQNDSDFQPWAPLRNAALINPPVIVTNFSAGVDILHEQSGATMPSSLLEGSVVQNRHSHLMNLFTQEQPEVLMGSYGLTKNSHIKDNFTYGFLISNDIGLTGQIFKRYGMVHKQVKMSETADFELHSLKIVQCKEPFYVLLYGHTVALIIVILEYILNRKFH